MKISEINKGVSDYINSIRYGKNSFGTKTWKVSKKITIDYKNVLPAPPDNTSTTTKKEIAYLSKLTKNLTKKQINFVHLVDEDPLNVFLPLLRMYNIPKEPAMKEINSIWNLCVPVIMNLKWIHNRARPHQIAEYLGHNINVIETKTHKTPSYPSGHTALAAIGSYYLSDKHPKLSSEFFAAGSSAGLARELQGVHYPSDSEASMVIAGALWQDIKYQ